MVELRYNNSRFCSCSLISMDPSRSAEWSELPGELLQLISCRLESPLYRLRLRSVCSSWRSSTPPTPTLPPPLPLTSTFSLSTHTLLLLTPPHHPPSLLKLKHSHHHNPTTFTLLHPLSRLPLTPPPFSLNLLRLPALHLAREFLLSAASSATASLYMEKLVLTTQTAPFALLTIHISGKLALFRSSPDPSWTIIPDMPTPYDDVCVFRGTLHAVDNTGRTVTVALPDASLALAAAPVFGGDKKFLVESDGALLLVDLFLSNDREFEDFDDFDAFEWERTVRFDVFSLDREGKRWVEVRSLGDRVLFLGDDCAFSASAKDLGVRRGNCVVFRDDGLGGTRVQNGMGVFYLDDGKISPLPECPDFAQLFRPPDWPSLQLH